MTLERREVVKSLRSKGFKKEERANHTQLRYWLGGRKTSVWTQVSRGSQYRDLGPQLERQMAGQCRLRAQEFRDLVECSMSEDDYATWIRSELGLLPN